MNNDIIEDAKAAGADIIDAGERIDQLYEGERTLYRHCLFSENELTKFAAIRDARKSEPVGEVVMCNEPEWMKPRECFKWYQQEFPLGTKFYTSPPTDAVKDALEKVYAIVYEELGHSELASNEILKKIRNLIGEVK